MSPGGGGSRALNMGLPSLPDNFLCYASPTYRVVEIYWHNASTGEVGYRGQNNGVGFDLKLSTMTISNVGGCNNFAGLTLDEAKATGVYW